MTRNLGACDAPRKAASWYAGDTQLPSIRLTTSLSAERAQSPRNSTITGPVARTRARWDHVKLDQTLYDAFGQRQIATIYGPLTQYHVILELESAQRGDPGVLNRVYITRSASQAVTGDESVSGIAGGFRQASPAVPLAAVVRAERRLAPLAITHPNDQLFRAAEYRDVTVAWRNGAPVRLGDVAEVVNSVINTRLAGLTNPGYRCG